MELTFGDVLLMLRSFGLSAFFVDVTSVLIQVNGDNTTQAFLI